LKDVYIVQNISINTFLGILRTYECKKLGIWRYNSHYNGIQHNDSEKSDKTLNDKHFFTISLSSLSLSLSSLFLSLLSFSLSRSLALSLSLGASGGI
jgi:hypothetical protein